MADKETKSSVDEGMVSPSPLVFISHDSRDAELAEAFSKLLKSVSAGMIKTFRSSDRKGTEGIDFGDEWYRRLMTALDATSEVVCLFTERSIDRPWILFEAGVAKGKLDRPVIGIALGVPLSRITTGPFYQFQNMDDGEEDLAKLVYQLAKRVPGLELDADVLKIQISAFKASEAEILEKLGAPNATKESAADTQVAKLVEELKSLPARVAERVLEASEFGRRKRPRRLNPMMIEEIMLSAGSGGDPVAILMIAGLLREDAPWLYELAMEAYRAVKSGNRASVITELERVDKVFEGLLRGPLVDDVMNKETYLVMRELPYMLRHILAQALEKPVRSGETKKPARKPKRAPAN